MPQTKLSEHFTLAEATFSDTAVRKGLSNEPQVDTIKRMVEAAKGMERVRSLLGHSIRVSSWFRSLYVNRAVGSSDKSDHVLGYAIDFTCPAYGTPLDVCKAIVASNIAFSQIIWEGTWVHISFNPESINRRQVLTAVFVPGKKTKYLPGLVPR